MSNFMEELSSTDGDPNAFSRLVFGDGLDDPKPGLHEGQRNYAARAQADVNFLLPGNSWGKTEFIVRHATYEAWFKKQETELRTFEAWLNEQYNMLLASYEYDTIGESYERFGLYYRANPRFRQLIEKMTSSPTPEIRFVNGSRIDFGSLKDAGKHVEATRYKRIYIDEAGHIPDISYTFDSVLYPRTMGVSGRIHLIGTPKPHSDPYLLEIYEKGKTGSDPFYFSYAGSVMENEFWPTNEVDRVLRNPRYVKGWRQLSPGEELDGALARAVRIVDGEPCFPILTPMGKQVVLGAFVIAGGYFFNRFHVSRMFGEWREEWGNPVWDGPSFRIPPKEGRLYMGAFDLAGNKVRKRKKKGSDPTVGMVIDYTERPWRLVCFDFVEGGEADWEQKYGLMDLRYREYRLPYLIIDATGNVDSVQEALQKRGVEVLGINFGGNSNKKFDMLRNLQLCTEMVWDGVKGVIRAPLIPQLKYEMDHYVLPDEDITQDCVMTLAMAAHELAQNEVPEFVTGEVW